MVCVYSIIMRLMMPIFCFIIVLYFWNGPFHHTRVNKVKMRCKLFRKKFELFVPHTRSWSNISMIMAQFRYFLILIILGVDVHLGTSQLKGLATDSIIDEDITNVIEARPQEKDSHIPQIFRHANRSYRLQGLKGSEHIWSPISCPPHQFACTTQTPWDACIPESKRCDGDC